MTSGNAAVFFRRLLRIDWDVVAGIIAALVAMLLSFMGLVSETVGLGIILLLCALLLTRDLRGEAREIRMFDKLDLVKRQLVGLTDAVKPSDIQLIGPKKMRQGYVNFATALHGDVRWFNACCRMFRRQEVFDATLRPLIDNPNVTSIRLMCRPEEQQNWKSDVLPKLRKCENGDKVHEPSWGAIRGNISFLIGDIDGDGRNEALVSILDEPFAAYNVGPTVPRFLLRAFSACDLMAHLEEVVRHASSDFSVAGRPEADSGPAAE